MTAVELPPSHMDPTFKSYKEVCTHFGEILKCTLVCTNETVRVCTRCGLVVTNE